MYEFVRRLGIVGLLVGSFAAVGGYEARGAKRSLPEFTAVRTVVDKHFATLRGYQSGDLISQADWDAVAKELDRLGWKPTDAAQIRGALLPEKSFLIQQSRSQEGRAFMRQIARMPQGYDRLDHLSRIPYGEPTIRRLIDGPDGYKMLEYMTTAPGGRELGKMLSVDEGGANFNKPTDRIYTAEALLQQLQQSYTNDSRPPAPRQPISVP
jgi:hypothetical protein